MEYMEKTHQDLLKRLRRIEGQVRGLQRMIDEDKECSDIITQLSAVRSALDQVGFVMLSNKMAECVRQKIEKGQDGDKALEDAMKLFLRLA